MKMGLPILLIFCATAVFAFLNLPANSSDADSAQDPRKELSDSSPTVDRAVEATAATAVIPQEPEPEATPEAEPEPLRLYGKKIKSTYQVKVIRAVDGDTFEVLLPDNTHPNFRFESVDTPETGSKNVPGQPFGKQATEALKELCVGKMATVHQTGSDGYRRPVVYLVVDGVNINVEMIRLGYAWHAIDYSKDKELAAFEAEAREAGRGLWADPNPMAPWEWRRQLKEQRKKKKQAQQAKAKSESMIK